MSGSNIDPEVMPSTSQSGDGQKTAIFPLVSMPQVVLTRLDLENLPMSVHLRPSSSKKPVKRLTEKNHKPLVSKTPLKKTDANVKHDTRFRGKPKKDYKMLSEMGTSFELAKSIVTTEKTSGIVKKPPKLTARTVDKEEHNTVKGMLKKTMLQKRSKIAIPPAKKPKLLPKKTNAIAQKSKKEKANVTPTPRKEILPTTSMDILFQSKPMDTDTSEDEFLYDELIDELVNSPNKKGLTADRKTNITLKPNVGNKPPTIVKGGIVKKSSLPPDLKSVANPTILNSSKLTGTALAFKSKPPIVEHVINTPATAETPRASLPSKASPFPIAINSSPSKSGPKGKGKKGPKTPAKSSSVTKDNARSNFKTPKTANKPTKVSPTPKVEEKTSTPISKPKGKPKIGPKQVIQASLILNSVAGDESDEYTEVETLENIDCDPVELSNLPSGSEKNEDILTLSESNGTGEPGVDRTSGSKSKQNDDPHLDLLRILTDDTEDATQSEPSEIQSESPHNYDEENVNVVLTPDPPNDDLDNQTTGKSKNLDAENVDIQKTKNSSRTQAHEVPAAKASEGILNNKNEIIELPCEPVVEETPPVRTIYDLMSEVSLKYPSWNLHIIPETNAFCIAQVTKGRLGLPTLKKCIELDPDMYSAKVYIHQYHIKRFDGVYDSEEAILALVEEIHSIKA